MSNIVEPSPDMRLLCLDCGTETDYRPGLICCPECGSTAIPADLNDSVTVRITNHELRVLTIWASNWARACTREGGTDLTKPMATILARLGTQTAAALSLSQEIADLRAALPDTTVRVYDEGGREMDI